MLFRLHRFCIDYAYRYLGQANETALLKTDAKWRIPNPIRATPQFLICTPIPRIASVILFCGFQTPCSRTPSEQEPYLLLPMPSCHLSNNGDDKIPILYRSLSWFHSSARLFRGHLLPNGQMNAPFP